MENYNQELSEEKNLENSESDSFSKQQSNVEYHTDYGFIITRHVNSEKTNRYWNRNVKLLRGFYPNKLIVVIDDNSNPAFLKPQFNYKNIITIQSEYPGRGELLPYIYYNRNKWFDHAVIIHDGVFFHKRLAFEKYLGTPAIPIWHFNSTHNVHHLPNSLRIAKYMNHTNIIQNMLQKKTWTGCFGVQSFIKHKFLNYLFRRYNVENLINVVTCREDRCSLERIFAVMFYLELKIKGSILGDMTTPPFKFGLTFEEYLRRPPKLPVIKVFTGR